MVDPSNVPDAIPVVASGFSWTAAGAWGSFLALVALVVRIQPLLRRVRLESDNSLRADLLKRISDLEKQQVEERRDCERRIREVESEADERIKALEHQVAGLIRDIAQHSQSSAMLMHNPDKVAVTGAARKRRGED